MSELKFWVLVNEEEGCESVLHSHEIDDMYHDMLDECYEPVNICGYEYPAGKALEAVDPVAYRCGRADYESSLYEDGYNEYHWTQKQIDKFKKKHNLGD